MPGKTLFENCLPGLLLIEQANRKGDGFLEMKRVILGLYFQLALSLPL
jgi:hypothetical protein